MRKTIKENTSEEIRRSVRHHYKEVITTGTSCGQTSCCGSAATPEKISLQLGYSDEEINQVPEGANAGLGCGNPTAIAGLKTGETVLDLGSGAGFDCFLAASKVGETGRIIGVDMTPEMIEKSRLYAKKGGYKNVEFRLGEIEHLPVADATVDIILSNCVINLSFDKKAVYSEIYRVLKPGGRICISDVVATSEVPARIRNDMKLWSSCAAGASNISELEEMLKNIGFVNIFIKPQEVSRDLIKKWAPESNLDNYFVSAIIEAKKNNIN